MDHANVSTPPNTPARSSLRQSRSFNIEEMSQQIPKRSVHFSLLKDCAEVERTLQKAVETLGGCSLWIILMLILCSWPMLIVALQNSVLSLRQSLQFRCFVPGLRNSSWSFQMRKNISMPSSENGDQCTMFDANYKWLSRLVYDDALEFVQLHKETFPIKICKQIVCDYHYFDEEYLFVEQTEQANSKCGKYVEKYLKASGLAGQCLNDILMGLAADIYGRKPIIQINVLICFVGMVVTLFASSPWIFIVGKVLMTGGAYAYAMVSYIYYMELCSKQMRPLLCQAVFMGWGVGYLIAPLLFNNIYKWFYLHVCTIPFILVSFFAIWYIPESPRWLISTKKYLRAKKVIDSIDISLLRDEEEEFFDLPEIKRKRFLEQLHMFERSKLGYRIIKSTIMYVTTLLTYYASQKGAIYTNIDVYNYYILLSLISLMHPFTSTALLIFFGRKLSVACMYALLSVLYCTVLAEAVHQKIQFALFMLILNFSTISANITIQHTVEMYPVSFSATAIGFCASMGTISVFLNDIVVKYKDYTTIRFAVYLIFSGTAMVVVLFLPETSGKLLPLSERAAKQLH